MKTAHILFTVLFAFFALGFLGFFCYALGRYDGSRDERAIYLKRDSIKDAKGLGFVCGDNSTGNGSWSAQPDGEVQYLGTVKNKRGEYVPYNADSFDTYVDHEGTRWGTPGKEYVQMGANWNQKPIHNLQWISSWREWCLRQPKTNPPDTSDVLINPSRQMTWSSGAYLPPVTIGYGDSLQVGELIVNVPVHVHTTNCDPVACGLIPELPPGCYYMMGKNGPVWHHPETGKNYDPNTHNLIK